MRRHQNQIVNLIHASVRRRVRSLSWNFSSLPSVVWAQWWSEPLIDSSFQAFGNTDVLHIPCASPRWWKRRKIQWKYDMKYPGYRTPDKTFTKTRRGISSVQVIKAIIKMTSICRLKCSSKSSNVLYSHNPAFTLINYWSSEVLYDWCTFVLIAQFVRPPPSTPHTLTVRASANIVLFHYGLVRRNITAHDVLFL